MRKKLFSGLMMKFVSFLVVGTVIFGSMIGVLDVRQVEAVIIDIDGDVTINNDTRWQDAIYRVDGHVTISAGATLEIVNGGLVFLQDITHVHNLTIQAPNGELHLTNSMVSTWLDQINSYPKLNVHVYGRLVMDTNSMLKFPGTLNAYFGSFVELKNSMITGFSREELGTYVSGDEDEYDDAPIMNFRDSTVDLYDSRIEKLYENAASGGPDFRYNITLQGNTEMTIVNSYVGVDFSSDNKLHNVILADDTSIVYIYNMTIDEDQNPSFDSQRSPCLQPYGNVILGSDTALPDAIHPSLDNTTTPGQDETFLQFDDDIRYIVKPGERMYIDGFDLDLPYVMTGATLGVRYSTDAGYDGTRPVQWGLEGKPGLLNTTITPVDTNGIGNEIWEAFDIYSAGMDTFNELRYLDITFYNDATLTPNVYFERIWIDVDYYVIDSQAIFYIHRWLVPTVRDENGAPVEGADVTVTFLANGSSPQYPDNGWLNNPNAKILNYLGKTVLDYGTTGSDGKAWIPLLAEWMNSTLQEPTFPNTEFFGNFNATATYDIYSNFATMSFNPFPAMSESDNTFILNIYLTGLVLPRPDLTPTSIWTDPPTIHARDNVTLHAMIENVGQWPAIDIWVDFVVGQDMLQSCHIDFLSDGASYECQSMWINASVGTHIVVVDVDPPIETGGKINESNEGNNRLSVPISVEPVLPDLVAYISAPGQGYPGNPVTITATIRNEGNASVMEKFFVEFFVNGNSISIITYSEIIDKNGTITLDAEWTPSVVGNYTLRVVVDTTDTVQEISEDNNEATWDIQVVPVPNLVVVSDYVSPDDPCPSEGQDIRANAWISNLGQVDADIFEVAFWIDDVWVGNWTSSAPLAPGGTVLATSPMSQPAGSPGFGEITVMVDPSDSIRESSNVDNTVTAQYMVYTGSETTWWMDKTVDYNVAPTDNLVITGNIVIMNANLTITQSGPGIGRHYVKIRDGGTLTLVNAVLNSYSGGNWPLNVCVLDNGTLTAEDNSQFLLDSPGHGRGVLFSRGNGSIDLRETLFDGDIRATGFDVSLKNVDLTGEVVFIYTQNTSYIWDTVFWTVDTLSLYTDDGDVNTVDFDIRNVSFSDPVLDQQLVFGGEQWIWLTDVETFIDTNEDWWTNMIVGNAKVSVFYWLTIELVDGTGSLLPQSNLTLYQLDPNALNWSIAVDDLGNPVDNKTLEDGVYVYRALSQVRYAVDDSGPWTYLADGSKFLPVENRSYYPDRVNSTDVKSNTLMRLWFSALTPEFWIEAMYFDGGNGISYDQPHNWPLDVVADIHNDGKIMSTNVEVYFYATELDPDGDGIMQNDPSTFEAVYIGLATINISANGTTSAIVTWEPGAPTMIDAGNKVSVFIDMYDKIKEVNELNNINMSVVRMFRWPDLDVPWGDIITVPTQVPVNSPVTIEAKVRNIGAREATNVRVEFLDDGTSIGSDTIPIIQSSGSALATVTWVADTPGPHEVKVIAYTENLTIENKDYNWENNEAAVIKSVLSLPDLMVNSTSIMGLGSPPNVTQARDFAFIVRVHNLGESSVASFSIEAYMESTSNNTIASLSNLTIGGNTTADFELTVDDGLDSTGTYDLIVVVDSKYEVTEENETNNEASISLAVNPPKGFVTITEPVENKEFRPGVTILVRGQVQTNQMDPIPGIRVYAQLLEEGTPVPETGRPGQTDSNGKFTFSNFEIPDNVKGTFTIVVTTNITSITDGEVIIKVVKPVPWWEIMILGLPLWLWLIIIAVIVAIVVGVTLYLYFVGLGKLVECGNCGAFIPEASVKCPKCGIEFEKDLAKCSSCGAWIPIGVKMCPECGVEFATGELEMEEYREKMRMQYEEVVAKFRSEADKALGRTLTEEEFQEWWKTQPTFMTFEDWLREEEEMRKMGSRPCPSCGTLNSVTAKVCHKCGTLFEEVEEAPPKEKPPEKPAVKAAPPVEARPPVEKKAVPEERLEKIEKPVPKKVVKKPVERPVVQKKVIKKPVAEEEKEEEEI